MLTAAISLCFTGCKSSTATTAHYRGDALYGDAGSKPSKKKPGNDKGAQTSRQPNRYHDKELLARAKKMSDPLARALVEEAEAWLGTPYVWGGTTRQGTDCSGMVMSIYNNVCGVKMPRTSNDMSLWCQPVARDAMQPGDLVFFSKDGNRVSHVGMYVGQGQMIHASSSRGVMVSSLDISYWVSHYYGSGRVASAETAWNSNGRKALRSPQLASANTSTSRPAPVDAQALLPYDDMDEFLDAIITQKVDSILGSHL